ncbi:MAG: methyltransferase domain-containing protein [Patescibacteria group bacterium]|nr:methyltransferase domain-containing protein [Patescibacteria group bacterium]MDD5715939.1 methyltransferase domain-containing protein [Patescibacteria group bacterium]
MASKNNRATTSDVSYYYDVITNSYRSFWGEFFHPAIYENEHDDRVTALRKTHSRFIKDACLNPGDSFIDLGCGIGGLTCYVAQKCRCRGVGITISKYQIAQAKKLARVWQAGSTEFRLLDIIAVEQLGEKFDAAFLVDVGCHLPDKALAMKKIAAVLKPGGRLVIADWLQKEHPNALERELLLEPFNRYWHFPSMESLAGYKKIIRKAGMRVVQAEDVSIKTRKNWEFFYDLAVREVGKMDIEQVIRYVANPAVLRSPRRALATAKNQFYANSFTKLCFDAGVFRYGYIVCEK